MKIGASPRVRSIGGLMSVKAGSKLVALLLQLAPLLTVAVLIRVASPVAFAVDQGNDDWPQFRGPAGDGVSMATNLPLTWSLTQNVKWKSPVPGRGRSSP